MTQSPTYLGSVWIGVLAPNQMRCGGCAKFAAYTIATKTETDHLCPIHFTLALGATKRILLDRLSA